MEKAIPFEGSPVLRTEEILRRVACAYYVEETRQVHRLAFRPTEHDSTGISVYRHMLTSARAVAEAAPKPTYVAGVSVKRILELSLQVLPDPCPPLPGHSIIPELNCRDYCDPEKKKLMKEWQTDLALAASARILWSPREGEANE